MISLHVHNSDSILDGLGTQLQNAELAAKLNQYALGESNHGTLSGSLKHIQACNKVGIMPICGNEGYFRPNRKVRDKEWRYRKWHMVLFAKNLKGWHNLIRISSAAYDKNSFYQYPCWDWELLEKYHEGLICSTSCVLGPLPFLIENGSEKEVDNFVIKSQKLFGDDFYIAVMPHDSDRQKKVNLELISLANKFGAPIVYEGDSHYPYPGWVETQKIAILIGTNSTVADAEAQNKKRIENNEEIYELWHDGLHIMEEAEVRASFSLYHPDIPVSVVDEAIRNTDYIGSKIEPFLIDRSTKMPRAGKRPGEAEEIVTKWCREGMDRVGRSGDEIYEKRLAYELGVIRDRGNMNYFMITGDWVRWAKSINPLPGDLGQKKPMRIGSGRGSVAGSLVSYLCNITTFDPIAYKLKFERFLNLERKGLPDIDIDFPSTRRNEAKEYLARKYGEDCIADVVAFQHFQPRAALKNVTKVLYGFDSEVYNEIARICHEDSNLIDQVHDTDLEKMRLRIKELDIWASEYQIAWREAVRLENASEPFCMRLCVAGDTMLYPSNTNETPMTIQKLFSSRRWDKVGALRNDGYLGYGKIDEIYHVGYKETYEIFAGENSLCTTLDHRFLTEEGWKKLRDIKVGDKVAMNGSPGNKYSLGKGKPRSEKPTLFTFRRRVFEANDHKCECGKKATRAHHILPIHLGGTHATDNGKPMCDKCHKNLHKEVYGWYTVPMKPKWVDVRSIKKVGERDCYDMSVIDIENFVANGFIVHNSKHAAGVVITPDIITNYMPTLRSDDNEVGSRTAWSETPKLSIVEDYGFVKWDALGLTGMDQQQMIVDAILDRTGEFIDLDKIPPLVEPYNVDDKVMKAFQDGRTLGTNQFPGNGVTSFVMRAKPENIIDLAAVNALYRPGPMGKQGHFHYADRKNGKKEVFIPDILKDILSETYSSICFQEQVMDLFSVLSGYTDSQADGIRKIIAKLYREKGSAAEDELNKHKDIFLSKAAKKIGEEEAKRFWEEILPYTDYSFNKSHSSGYAIQAYQDQWLKTYYPLDFYATLMTLEPKDSLRAIKEARYFDIKILPPDINISNSDYTPDFENNALRYGLNGIKGIAETSSSQIMKMRPYSSIGDFEQRMTFKYSKVNKKHKEILLRVGALDSLGGRSDWTSAERAAAEVELLGISLFPGGTLGEDEQLVIEKTHSEEEYSALEVGSHVAIGGQIVEIKPTVTKKGKNIGAKMGFVKISLGLDSFQCTFFPEQWARFKDLIFVGSKVMISGRKDERGIIVDSMMKVEDYVNEINGKVTV